MSDTTWNEVQEFLLPESHPLKSKLDKIFSKSKVTKNKNSLEAAGFKRSPPNSWSQTIVTTHEKIKGYIFKLFTDDQRTIQGCEKLKKRVTGAKSLRAAIDRHHFQEFFIVPQKWLYPLNDSFHSFILVAEDCHLLTHEGNKARWKNVTDPELLKALFILLKEEGLADSTTLVNIPFNIDGKVCFIDLEIHHQWPVNYNQLTSCLSKKMQKHWTTFFQQN